MKNKIKSVIFTWNFPKLFWMVQETQSGEIIDSGSMTYFDYTRSEAIAELRLGISERYDIDTCRIDRKNCYTDADFRKWRY